MKEETDANLTSLLTLRDHIGYIKAVLNEAEGLKLKSVNIGSDNEFYVKLSSIADIIGLDRFNDMLHTFKIGLISEINGKIKSCEMDLSKYKVIKED